MTTKRRSRSARYEVGPREIVSILRWFVAFFQAIILSFVQKQYDQLRENNRQRRLFGRTHRQAEIARLKATKKRRLHALA